MASFTSSNTPTLFCSVSAIDSSITCLLPDRERTVTLVPATSEDVANEAAINQPVVLLAAGVTEEAFLHVDIENRVITPSTDRSLPPPDTITYVAQEDRSILYRCTVKYILVTEDVSHTIFNGPWYPTEDYAYALINTIYAVCTVVLDIGMHLAPIMALFIRSLVSKPEDAQMVESMMFGTDASARLMQLGGATGITCTKSSFTTAVSIGMLLTITYDGEKADDTPVGAAFRIKVKNRMKALGSTETESEVYFRIAKLAAVVFSPYRRRFPEKASDFLRSVLSVENLSQVQLTGKFLGLSGPSRVSEALTIDEQAFTSVMSTSMYSLYTKFVEELKLLSETMDGVRDDESTVIEDLQRISFCKASNGAGVVELSKATYGGLYRHALVFLVALQCSSETNAVRQLNITAGTQEHTSFVADISVMKRVLSTAGTDVRNIDAADVRSLVLIAAANANDAFILSKIVKKLLNSMPAGTIQTMLTAALIKQLPNKDEASAILMNAFTIAGVSYRTEAKTRRAREIAESVRNSDGGVSLPANVRQYLEDLEFESAHF